MKAKLMKIKINPDTELVNEIRKKLKELKLPVIKSFSFFTPF